MRIGITGHRDYKNRKNIKRWMRGIAKQYPESTIVTGGALGTDLICAEEAIAAGLKSEIILPMPEEIFTGRWKDAERERLMWVGIDSVVECLNDGDRYEVEFLFERNQEIVNSCDMMICFWDGRQRGGTWHTVKLAMKRDDLPMWNGISRERIVGDGPPLSDLFATPEACIEGWERLEEEVGYAEFGLTTLESNFECHGGVVFEKHEHTGEPDPVSAITARVWSATTAFPWEAEQIAAEILDFGIEYEKYWIDWLKKVPNFATTWDDLSYLSIAMAELAVSTLDVTEQQTATQGWNSDPSLDTAEIIVSSCYAWHRVGDRDWMESESGSEPKVSKAAERFEQIILDCDDHKLKQLGKQLFEFQKQHPKLLMNSEWTALWKIYREREPKETWKYEAAMYRCFHPTAKWENKEVEFDVVSTLPSPPEPLAREVVWMDVDDAVFVNTLAGSVDVGAFSLYLATQPAQMRRVERRAKESAKFATIALQNGFTGDYARVQDDYLMSFA